MRQKWAALLSLASMIVSPILPAIAQDVMPPGNAGIATYDGGSSVVGSAPVGPTGGYLYFRQDIQNGVGYQDGFSTVGGFLPFMLNDNQAFFGQVQVFVTENSDVGANLGGGYRYYFEGSDRVAGAYGFYDSDETPRGTRNDQLGIGIETLGPMWDFRANGYIPLDREEKFIGLNALTGPPVFSGNNLILNGTGFFEKPMSGGDFEFGFPLLDPSCFGRLRVYMGGYSYNAHEDNQLGARGRLEAHINEHVTVGAAFMHDDVNGDLITMAVDIRGWSSRLPGMSNREVSNKAKMYLPAVRQYRIANESFVDGITTTALGANGQPLNIVWVDNSNNGAGNGTFEDPFTTLPANAAGANYVLVRRGDSSEVNPVIGGITLEDGQRLFGEGFNFNLTVTGTTFGPQFAGNYSIQSLLPAWNTGGQHPFVSNPGGNVVTLANNNEVGGLNIVDSAGHGITGTGINNFRLFDLNIGSANPGFGNGGAGISLVNASGLGTIENFTLFNNAAGGLLVNNTGAAALTLEIEGTAQANPLVQIDPNVTGGAVGLSLIADNSTIDAEVSEFFNSGSGTGAILTATNGANLDVEITSGRFDGATAGDGIQATVNNATLTMSLEDVSADDATTGNGIHINLSNNANFIGLVSGSSPGDASFSGNNGDGVRVIVDGSPNGSNRLDFLQANVDDNGGDGLHIELTNASLFELTFQNGTATGNAGDNIDTDVDGGSTLDLLVDPTDLSGAGQNGFRFNVVNGSTLNAIFDQVTLNGNVDNGILGTLDTAGVANLDFTRVSVSSNGEHGMFVTALGGSTFNGDFVQAGFNGNSTSAAGFDGMNFVADAGTINFNLTDSFAGNTGGGNQGSGIQFLVQNAGAADIDVLRSNLTLNDDDGVLGEVHGAGSTGTISFSASTVSDNGDNGTHLIVDTGASLIATVSGSTTMSGNGQDGFLVDANDAGTTVSVTMASNNQFNNHLSGAGVRINATDIDEIDAIISGSASNNADEGMEFSMDNVADANLAVTGFGTVSDNGLDGIQFNVTNGTTITGLVTSGVSPSGNGLNGIQVNIDNSTIAAGGGPLNPTVRIGGGSIDDNGANGIELNLDTVTAAVDSVRIGSASSISDNGGNGIHVNLTSTPLDGLQVVNNSGVSGNTGHGLRFDLTGSNLTNLLVSGNSFTNNGDAGVEFFGDSNVAGTFSNNTISNNAAEGVAINLNNAETFSGVFTGNTISGNALGGLMVTAEDTSSFDLTIGGPLAANGNTFSGNTGAGLGILLSDTARGRLNVQNSRFNNTLAAAGPFFVGQGIHVRQFDSSTLDGLSSVVDSTFTGNAAQGLHMHVQDFADLEGMLVDGNTFNNSGTGIDFIRLGTGNIGTLGPVVISDNTISGSANGIALVARNANNLDVYQVDNNTITDAGGVGILIEHGFDAQLFVNMDGNTITGSGSHGIQTFQTAGTLTPELRRLFGTWQNLTIDDNAGDGIQLGAVMGDTALATPLQILNSDITNNGGDGIAIPGPGRLLVQGNLIEGNGEHGIIADSVGVKLMTFDDNVIRLNDGDGMRIVNNTQSFNMAITNNLIELNGQRGINVLNQGDGQTTLDIRGNTINSNGNEGVHIMNTSSTTQSADFGAALAADGAVDRIPRINLTFGANNLADRNIVQGNGNSGTSTDGTPAGGTGGFILRVGTSDGSDSFTDPGGTATGGRGGVVATMDGNLFVGNAGFDVYFDSFTSTIDPPATVSGDGWTDQNENPRVAGNDTFDIDSYRADPLARLDLVFTNNTGDEIDATNPGASYSNDEPVFKSRTAAQDNATDDPVSPPDDPGPFNSGTRVRNAQRLAFRGALPPTIAAGATYLFPGVGLSSFRVQQSGNSFTNGTGFILDVGPTTGGRGVNAGDVGQNPTGGPFSIDFMPWGWSLLP